MYKKIKSKKQLLLPLILLIVSITGVMIVSAKWPALEGSGYAATSNVHGEEVLPGTLVTAKGGTTDTIVSQVTFIWRDPDANEEDRETVTVSVQEGTTSDGTAIWVFYSSAHALWDLGDWGVQVVFQDSTGRTIEGLELDNVIKIRATSMHVVPEFPIGTLGPILSLLAGFGFYLILKRH